MTLMACKAVGYNGRRVCAVAVALKMGSVQVGSNAMGRTGHCMCHGAHGVMAQEIITEMWSMHVASNTAGRAGDRMGHGGERIVAVVQRHGLHLTFVPMTTTTVRTAATAVRRMPCDLESTTTCTCSYFLRRGSRWLIEYMEMMLVLALPKARWWI